MEGFPESLREHFWEMSEDIRQAFFRVRPPFWSSVREQTQPKLGLDLAPKLSHSDSPSNSDPDSNLTNRTPRQFEVSSPSSASGDFNAPKLDLGLQASLSFRCTSSQVIVNIKAVRLFQNHDKLITEARTGSLRPRAGVVAKPSPLGDERGSVREIGLCV